MKLGGFLFMLSDVVAVGFLADLLDRGFRNLIIENHDVLRKEKTTTVIPLLFWSKTMNNSLTLKRRGSKVLIRGRIESDEKLGLYILVEYIQTFKD